MQKTLIIGDIHGCHAELLELLAKAGIGDEDLVVSVGDLVDRGPEPGEVVDWFRARENSVVICGNHERKHVRGVLSYSQQITRLQIGARYEEQVRWMAGLPYHWEREDVRVVHWGLFPGVPLAELETAIVKSVWNTSAIDSISSPCPNRLRQRSMRHLIRAPLPPLGETELE